MLKLASILLGIAAGYIFSAFFGMVDLSAVKDAGIFSLPEIAPFGIRFEFSSSLAFTVLFAINAVQAIGDMSATTIGGMNREPSGNELRGGIIGFGLSNLISAVFGGLPNATYSQNVGIVSSTKVTNRKVLAVTAAMLLIAGLIPKFSALLTTIRVLIMISYYPNLTREILYSNLYQHLVLLQLVYFESTRNSCLFRLMYIQC